jgi:prepilin-type N-terminal cleavage/methylation domain-containing protein
MERRAAGFTLVELLLCIAILSIATGVGYTVLAPYAQQRQLDAGLDRLAAALEFARERARAEGRGVAAQVQITGTTADANSIRLTWVADGTELVHPRTRRAYRIDFDTEPGLESVRIVESLAGDDDTVEFDARGEPVDSAARFVLACGKQRMAVRVEPWSGRIVVEDVVPDVIAEDVPVPR